MEGHECEEAEVRGHGNVVAILHTGTSQGARASCPRSPQTHSLLWGDRPSPALQPQHLEFLQLVVEAPEVLGKELRADGLPVDSNPLTHLHQVGRAAERPGVIGTPPFPSLGAFLALLCLPVSGAL